MNEKNKQTSANKQRTIYVSQVCFYLNLYFWNHYFNYKPSV